MAQSTISEEPRSCNYCVLARMQNSGQEKTNPKNSTTPGWDANTDLAWKLEQVETQLSGLTARLLRIETPHSSSSSHSSITDFTTSSTSSVASTSVADYRGSDQSSISSRPISPQQAHRNSALPSCLRPGLKQNNVRTTSEQTWLLWQQYLKGVDPLLNILNTSAVQHLFLISHAHVQGLSADAEALKLSVCFAAVASLRKSDQKNHPDAVKDLLKDYSLRVETAFTTCRLTTTPTVENLQALTIYLTCGRWYLDQTYIWSMTALLVRLAMRLKLHNDPHAQNVSSSNCEYRRRLWWYICSLDARTAEENGTDPLILEFQSTTSFPEAIPLQAFTNPALKSSLRTHSPDMFYSLIHFEITYYARTILCSDEFTRANGYPALSAKGKLSLIDSLEQTLRDKYFRHCNCKSAICVLTTSSTKALVAMLRLKILHPPQDSKLGFEDGEQILGISVEALEAITNLQTNPTLATWMWLWDFDAEWEVVLRCLATLAVFNNFSEVVSRAWTAINAFFNTWKDSSRTTAQELRWARLQSLKAKALRAQVQFGLSDQPRPAKDQRSVTMGLARSPAIKRESCYQRSVSDPGGFCDDSEILPETPRSPEMFDQYRGFEGDGDEKCNLNVLRCFI